MDVDIREIQPGWEVFGAAGEKVGDVVSVDSNAVHVKTAGLFSKHLYVPPAAIEEVESHRVELTVTKDELGNQGWDTPPA